MFWWSVDMGGWVWWWWIEDVLDNAIVQTCSLNFIKVLPLIKSYQPIMFYTRAFLNIALRLPVFAF